MIREMTEADLVAVNEIYNYYILNSTALYKYEDETIEQRKEWFNQKQQNNEPMFVYEEDGDVIGFVTYFQFRPIPGYKYAVEHSVYVHHEHSKKGIGTKLMSRLIEEADKRGVKTMVAVIDAENTGSIAAHEKLGFYFAGKIKNAAYKFGRWLDVVYYQLDLTGPKHLAMK